jgi:hypothetical protein
MCALSESAAAACSATENRRGSWERQQGATGAPARESNRTMHLERLQALADTVIGEEELPVEAAPEFAAKLPMAMRSRPIKRVRAASQMPA